MADNDQKSKKYYAASAPKPMGAYPHARRVGDLLFLSGIGPRDPETNNVPGIKLDDKGQVVEYDIAVQCHAVFDNVKRVLESSGAQWDQLVDITVFLTDINKDFGQFNLIYAEYFKENSPCRTTVGVTGLPSPIAIELKCIAWSPNS